MFVPSTLKITTTVHQLTEGSSAPATSVFSPCNHRLASGYSLCGCCENPLVGKAIPFPYYSGFFATVGYSFIIFIFLFPPGEILEEEMKKSRFEHSTTISELSTQYNNRKWK